MKKAVKVLKALLVIAIVVTVAETGRQTYLSATKSPVQRLVEQTQLEEKAGAAIAMGCIQKGMEDERLMPIIMMTGGEVCMQIVGGDIKKTIDGNGYTSLDNEKELFKIGYVKTAMALGYPVSTKEEIQARESEAEAGYEKSLEIRGGN